ncbi:lysophosphatidic acid receptor [Nitrosomonas sp. Nm166]|uniref:lysophosphatidic acid receptor n=1 Tax=Nitrosomonas sp. Nm166 TaxID=1881054 RepID=UPI000B81D0A9|nr:lysophosphatidic acid receptor [Nitrosomonas sp. Nm166]
MKEKSGHRSNWKKILIILLALIGGFLLSFLGLGLLWSGIPWHYQVLMFFPFFLLSFALSRWSAGAITACIFILCGAAPLGALMVQFRDINNSHLMTSLIVLSWLIGIASGYFLAKVLLNSRSESSENITLS